MSIERSLTLRQIEVIRAIMVAGSIAGAARLLNVAQPGVSRTMKHLEATLGIKLFTRRGGRYVPAAEARDVFEQLQRVHKNLEGLQYSIRQLGRGRDVYFEIGSVPSIAQVMVPRATARMMVRYPDIKLSIELLKIEEAIDYLLLGRGELACMSYTIEHPSLSYLPLATGELVCVAARSHPLARQDTVSAEEIAAYPLIGIDPNDPYGRILADIFRDRSLDYDIAIRARFGMTVIQLVRRNLGIAVLDSFTVADLHEASDDLVVLPIRERTQFHTYVAVRSDIELSGFAESFVRLLREEMEAVSIRV